MSRTWKHQFGTPNVIIQSEEKSILASVDKALNSSKNSQIVGSNGEIPLRSFFSRYLPVALRAVSGHFITPRGVLSPQLDIIIMDSRYPLLSENSDGSVLTPLHSVLWVLECKTRITTADAARLWRNANVIGGLASEVPGYQRSVKSSALAYRSRERAGTLAKNFFKSGTPEKGYVDLYLLRLRDQDIGAFFHFEGGFPSRDGTSRGKYRPFAIRLFTPLSDLYYRIIQESYYSLDDRGYSFKDIGEHLIEYMSWSTHTLDRLDGAQKRQPLKHPPINAKRKNTERGRAKR